MKVKTFFRKYLNIDTPICLWQENGDILFTGRLGDALFETWQGRDVLKVEGLGCENDLEILVSPRHTKAKERN